MLFMMVQPEQLADTQSPTTVTAGEMVVERWQARSMSVTFMKVSIKCSSGWSWRLSLT